MGGTTPGGPAELVVGLMSGTSLDGVDGVIVRFAGDRPGPALEVIAHAHRPFAPTLEAELAALNMSGPDELHRAALAGNAVALDYARIVADLLDATGLAPADILAVGAHGQTVRHRPLAFDGTGYTLQLLDPALLAERIGIDVIADFRRRDLAAGGQGAPLVPAFHRTVFAEPGRTVAVLNLGGIANLSVLDADGGTTGFDCGPGNTLMDGWCRRHTGAPFDAAGAWSATGTPIEPLLGELLAEPYFALAPPKSTGRDLFDAGWLDARIGRHATLASAAPADVQATLAELTARSCRDAVLRQAAGARRLWVCGGGAFNLHLMRRLAALLPGVRVASSAEAGLAPERVEAAAFAWLARAFVRREPGNLASVTGARGPRMLGALYPR